MTMAFMPSSDACTLLVRIMHPNGRARRQRGKIRRQGRPALLGCRPVNILGRIDGR